MSPPELEATRCGAPYVLLAVAHIKSIIISRNRSQEEFWNYPNETGTIFEEATVVLCCGQLRRVVGGGGGGLDLFSADLG